MAEIKVMLFSSREDLFQSFVKDVSNLLTRSIEKRGKTTIAISGGRTPQHFFPILSNLPLPWSKVFITLADERWLDPLHLDSNEGLVQRLLIQGPATAANFIGLKNFADNPFEGLAMCRESLKNLSWPLDGILLGMGMDGHIASLFPDRPEWLKTHDIIFPVAASANREARVSLTPTAILNCRQIFLVIIDPQRRTIFETAMQSGPIAKLPVRLILHQNKVPVTVYMLD